MLSSSRTARGVSPSPHVFSRGKRFFSTSRTSWPASASQYAHAAPDGPPPTTSTSWTAESDVTAAAPPAPGRDQSRADICSLVAGRSLQAVSLEGHHVL